MDEEYFCDECGKKISIIECREIGNKYFKQRFCKSCYENILYDIEQIYEKQGNCYAVIWWVKWKE